MRKVLASLITLLAVSCGGPMYGGHPLYYVVTDHNPGDTTGQGVDNFGAAWDVVGPDGKQIG